MLSDLLARQLSPPLRMLMDAIDDCPDDCWASTHDDVPVWQHVLHTIYYLEKWIRTPHIPFDPPAWIDVDAVDFTASAEPAVDRSILREYLTTVQDRALNVLAASSDGKLLNRVEINGGIFTLADQTIGQIRHVMYHVGCISSTFRRQTGSPLTWVGYDSGIDAKID